MRALTILMAALCALTESVALGAFMEIEATQIASIQPADSSQGPRILVQWTLPDMSGKIFDGAAISIALGTENGEALEFEVFPLTTSWDAQTCSWSSGWSKAGADFNEHRLSPTIITNKESGTILADVYRDIKEQLAGQATNYGFILVPRGNDVKSGVSIEANAPSALANAKLMIAYRNQR